LGNASGGAAAAYGAVSEGSLTVSTIAGHKREKDLAGCFIRRDGIAFARTHLVVALWEAWRLDDQRMVERTLRMAAKAARATYWKSICTHFLAEGSHITSLLPYLHFASR